MSDMTGTPHVPANAPDSSYGLIFVLFRPTSQHVENLRAARSQCDAIVAVDNTPEPDLALHDEFRAAGVDVVDNRNAGGLAGAYNRGTELLLERGVELVFLLDQDSTIDDSFCQRMAADCAPLRGTPFLVGPRIHETRAGNLMPLMPPTNPGFEVPEVDGLTPVEFLISSGSAFSAEAFRVLGEFREDFFIESVDIEYGLRGWARGVPSFANTRVTLDQTTGNISVHGEKFTFNHHAERCYYRARNYLFTLREYFPPRQAARALRFALQQVLLVLRFEDRKAQKVVATLAAVYDGLRGNLGRFEDVRPRTARFCTRR
ncbi:hypothetical protein [Nocardioides cavernaquae]|uniref:Glycosyltransferase n=1 Tax=Nocardioides cavernaquae TaxID=2321396 RepID=A0A3A5H7Q4_9ACTN|nr:hypothetical protein [Nocardioides cavernaquae]RJS45425.1 hypothetical protein D4739_03775 [Nocardioides cavernaquae]